MAEGEVQVRLAAIVSADANVVGNRGSHLADFGLPAWGQWDGRNG